jgi:hypothetical protein
MVCLRNICINTLHKGDNDDDNDNNNNNRPDKIIKMEKEKPRIVIDVAKLVQSNVTEKKIKRE